MKDCREEMAVPPGLASVTYPGPDGGALGATMGDGEVVAFGASSKCEVRIGYAPIRDRCVPGVAGRLLTIGSRLIVECAESDGYRALEVRAPHEPTRLVSLGEAFSPRRREFSVFIPGSSSTSWRLDVIVRRRAIVKSTSTEPTGLAPVELSDGDSELLACYAAPLRRGMLEPATHAQVAEAMHVDYNTARNRLYALDRKFFAAELPMPDINDRRIAVVECARAHHLLPDELNEPT